MCGLNGRDPETLPLILLLLGIVEWVAAALAGLLDQNLADKILWAKIEYIGVVSVPLALFVFVLSHSGFIKHLTLSRIDLAHVHPGSNPGAALDE